MDDLEDSKSFINANIDLVPSKLFLRALTAQKLSAQSKNDLERMDYLKEVRRRYILAGDQVFFPLNIEVQKAETRVMTYLARDELRGWAETWDEVTHLTQNDIAEFITFQSLLASTHPLRSDCFIVHIFQGYACSCIFHLLISSISSLPIISIDSGSIYYLSP